MVCESSIGNRRYVVKYLLIIVDMQNAFINENTMGIEYKIRDFIEETGIKDVVATRYINNRDTACYRFEGWKECMEGSMQTEVVETLKPYVKKEFLKHKYSCWNDEMKNYVRDNGYDVVLFAGVNTGCCVLHSVFDCYNDVMECRVIEDLCGSTSGKELHEAAITVIKSCITDERVIKSDTAKKYLFTTK